MTLLEIKKFKELKESELKLIIDTHYNHWVQHNPKMVKDDTTEKFSKIYTKEELPFGIALLDDNHVVGFCVLKLECLKKYPEFYKKLGFHYKQEVEKNEGGFGQLFYKNL